MYPNDSAQLSCWRRRRDGALFAQAAFFPRRASSRSLVTKNQPSLMKRIVTIAVLVGSSLFAIGQGMTLQEGQSYVFEFTSIRYVRPAETGNDCGQASAWFAQGTFNSGESALLEIFPNSLSGIPLSITDDGYDPSDSSQGIGRVWGPDEAPFFPDLQGVLRVTMLNGSAELIGFGVSQVVNGGFYSGYSVVPEPAAGTMLAAVLGWLALSKAWRPK